MAGEELESGAVATDEPVGDENPADDEALDVEVEAPEGEGESEAGDEEGETPATEAAPEANPWEGISWRHRQAAERAKRDAAWAAKAGPDVLEGLAEAQDELSRDWAAAGRKAAPETAATPSQPAPGQKAAQPKEDTPTEGEFAFDPTVLERYDEDWVKEVADPIQQGFRSVGQRLSKIEAVAQRMEEAEQRQQAERAMELVRSFITAPEIAAEFGDIYGNGDLASRKEGSPQAQAIADLYVNADAIFRRAAEIGRPISERAALERANSMLQSDRIRSMERDKGRKEAAAVAKTATRKPSSRSSPPKDESDKENKATVLGWMQKTRKRLGLGV